MVLLHSSDSEFLKDYPIVELKSTNKELINSADLMDKNGLIILFNCNHCPYAIALWDRLVRDYNIIRGYGFNLIAINPNIHPDYPDDSFDEMIKLSQKKELPFNYLVDETQETAKAFDAQCTPDLFVLNNTHKLLYRGAYDDNWQNSNLVKETFLLNALKEFNNGNISSFNSPKSMGCSIKWVKN